MEKARRRRVPAFGEWNYYYYSGELATPPAASEWCAAAAPELEARSDVWFKYSPPPRRPPPPPRSRKQVRPGPPEKMMGKQSYGGGGGKRATTPARASASDAVPPSKSAAGAASRARVVRRPVDADLYRVPTPDFAPDHYEPRRPWTRQKKASTSRWMGCFGFNCMRSG